MLLATEQTLTETEQTVSDADQTSSDSDQTSSDSDQLASDQDQAASDHDLERGLDPRIHESSRSMRAQTAKRRDLTAEARLVEASKRDEAARARDAAATARDAAAEARDAAMRRLDLETAQDGAPRATSDVLRKAAEQRKRAAEQRHLAATHRKEAARDRLAAARDREQARLERERALADRKALVRELLLAATDPLTGARMRGSGLTDLANEIERCTRTGQTLVVIYIDVVGLKACNDTHGHPAGDALLQRVVAAIREHVRSYDLVIRVGGDEFVCVMSGIQVAEAHRRFDQVTSGLAAGDDPTQITAGFAEFAPGETADELIGRADHDMIVHRQADSPQGTR
ncbi:MAG: GGDEF domain-containing protein [Actinomycetota bacterium]|nr:GGDEF domain-containing protein [Actinomycetota bacterium]